MLSQKKGTTKKHRKWDKRIDMQDEGFVHSVKINWKNNDTISNWNDALADILEVFGLPGNKFMTHPTFEYMDVCFKSKRDAELCRIMISEKLL